MEINQCCVVMYGAILLYQFYTGLLRRFAPRNDNDRLNIFIRRKLKRTVSPRDDNERVTLNGNCHCERSASGVWQSSQTKCVAFI